MLRAVRIRILLALCAGIAAALLTYAHLKSNGSSHATQHTMARDFALHQLDGTEVRLSSYRGKVVLLDFWATWCVPCREETPHFVELQQKYGDRGLQVIGISMDDTPDPVQEFSSQFHTNYPIVMGNAKIGEQYAGVLGLPIAFLIDRDGRIDKKHVGATSVSVFEQEISTLLQQETVICFQIHR